MIKAMEKPPISLCKATIEEGDYYNENGLLMCGKCHTLKEQTIYKPQGYEMFRRLESNPGYIIFPKNCDCKKADIEERETESRTKAAKERSERLRKDGLSDAQYKETTFAMDDGRDEKTTAFCKNYVDQWETAFRENHGIMLYGSLGAGKTFYASCIANALVDKGKTVMMTTISDLELDMMANWRQNKREILDLVRSVNLLILDDVGREQSTASTLEASYEIINARYKAKKPLVITTNLTRKKMRDEKDVRLKRIFSRLEEMCVPVLVDTVDRRMDIGEEKIKRAYALYGK